MHFKNEVTSASAERFTRTLIKKMYMHMTAVAKNVYIDELDKVADKYSNTYDRIIKMKPVNVQQADYDIEYNEKDPKLEVGDHVGIPKYKNFFAKKSLYDQKSKEILYYGYTLLMISTVEKLLKRFIKRTS